MAEKKEKTLRRMTIAELRSYKGFDKYTDEEAQAAIKSMEKLSMLFYELYMKQKHSQSKIKQLKGGNNEGKDSDEQRDAA
jgi:hypothetical protein